MKYQSFLFFLIFGLGAPAFLPTTAHPQNQSQYPEGFVPPPIASGYYNDYLHTGEFYLYLSGLPFEGVIGDNIDVVGDSFTAGYYFGLTTYYGISLYVNQGLSWDAQLEIINNLEGYGVVVSPAALPSSDPDYYWYYAAVSWEYANLFAPWSLYAQCHFMGAAGYYTALSDAVAVNGAPQGISPPGSK